MLAKRYGLEVEAPRAISGSALPRLGSSPTLVLQPPPHASGPASHAARPGSSGEGVDPAVLGLLTADPANAAAAGLTSSLYDGVHEQPRPVHERSRSQPTANSAHHDCTSSAIS